MDVDEKLDRPFLYFAGVNLLSAMASSMVLVTSGMYFHSINTAGTESIPDPDRIYNIYPNIIKWEEICQSPQDDVGRQCTQYNYRYMVGCFGITVGVLQLVLSLLSLATFYYPYRFTKNLFSKAQIAWHLLFLGVVVAVLVLLFTTAHENYEIELVRAESFYAVIAVFATEMVFLLFSIGVLGAITRKLGETEPDLDD